jgi:Cft2 family RNA processing exonuclease
MIYYYYDYYRIYVYLGSPQAIMYNPSLRSAIAGRETDCPFYLTTESYTLATAQLVSINYEDKVDHAIYMYI